MGWVYVITNESFKENLVKIGFTQDDNPRTRVRKLFNTSVPKPFDIEFLIYDDKPKVLEKKLHEQFSYCRQSSDREFFKIYPDEVKKIICEEYKLPIFSIVEVEKELKLRDNEAEHKEWQANFIGWKWNRLAKKALHRLKYSYRLAVCPIRCALYACRGNDSDSDDSVDREAYERHRQASIARYLKIINVN